MFGNWKPFKNGENAFYCTSKALFVLKIFKFLPWLLVIYRKGLIKKIKVNFKFYDVAASLTNNCNTHIVQYFEMSDFFFFMFACNNFPFCGFVTMIYWTSTEVLLNLAVPLDSAVPSWLWANQCFEMFGFDSVSIVFDSLSVSRSLPELYFSHSI